MTGTFHADAERLVALVQGGLERPPPIDWPAVQDAMGTVLPGDYKHVVERTGPLRVGGVLRIHAPDPDPDRDLCALMGRSLGALQVIKRDFGSGECPYPLWFEPGGLLPWGTTDNGEDLLWLTKGHPDQWTVVIGGGRTPGFEEFPFSTCGFVLEWLAGRIQSSCLQAPSPGTGVVRAPPRHR